MSGRAAAKLEARRIGGGELRKEYKFYKRFVECHGFLNKLYYGYESDYQILVFEALDDTIEDLLIKCRRFSLKTVLFIAEQLLARIEHVHRRGYAHCDVRPENLMMKGKLLYLIDFGSVRRFRDPATGVHFPCERKSADGRALRFSSVCSLQGYDQSRRDDMESIGYVLMYLLRGSLPWTGVAGRHAKERNEKIVKMKLNMTPALLCHGFPSEFSRYFESVAKLTFEGEPDYSGYRRMFRELGARENIIYDYEYDWEHPDYVPEKMPKLIPYSQPVTRKQSPRAKELTGQERMIPRNGPKVYRPGQNGVKRKRKPGARTAMSSRNGKRL